ncbi:MAG: rod-binding protein [Thermodesulfobacteriota bacterium]
MNLAIDPRVDFNAQASESGRENSTDKNPEALRQSCREFESVLINTMFQNMRKTVPDDGYLESDMSSDFYEEMLYMEAARHTARQGGFGLGEVLYEQLQESEFQESDDGA